jgi:hemerythrin-like domain-containing protein
MNAVESLIHEHQLIARLADALEAYAGETIRARPPDAAHLGLFAAAFRDFGECIHHEKEENILLPLLTRHGVSWDQGALPSVRRDHRQESYLIEVLRHLGERAASWHTDDRRHVSAGAQALVDFQRKHHELETAKLFPLIALRLGADELEDLWRALDKFDREHETQRAGALERIEELTARYAPARASGVHPVGSAPSAGAQVSEGRLGSDK